MAAQIRRPFQWANYQNLSERLRGCSTDLGVQLTSDVLHMFPVLFLSFVVGLMLSKHVRRWGDAQAVSRETISGLLQCCVCRV
jgi:hypothetical protein